MTYHKKKLAKHKLTDDDVQRMLRGIDVQNFWQQVMEKVSIDVEEYRYAQVKSLKEANHVFL